MAIIDEYIDISGSKIHYLMENKNADETIILLHGMKFTSDDWRRTGIIDNLANEGYNVIAVEIPGYGKSERLDMPYDDFLNEFANSLGLTSFHLLGPSFSGEISIKFALKYQKMLKSLIIVDSINVDKYNEKLKEIKVPTFIVWGKKDDLAPYKFATILKENISKSKSYTFDELGHTCYLKSPDVFSKELVQFLKEI